MDKKSNLASSLGEIVGLLTEIRDGLSVVSSTLAQIKEERESSPHTPYKEKGETPSKKNKENTPRTRVREEFKKPTMEEVAAHIREKGYVFDAEAFWNFYESNGWRVGRHMMKSWQSACVTWQKRCDRYAKRETERIAHIEAKMDERTARIEAKMDEHEAARTAHIDAKMDEREKKRETQMASRRRPSNWIAATPEQIKEFCDGLR